MQIEILETRRLLSAQTWVHAMAMSNVEDTSDPEESFVYGNVEVSWSASVEPGIDGYRVYRSADREHYEKAGETPGTRFVDTNLQTGIKWYYKIRPFSNAQGNRASLGTAWAVTAVPAPITQIDVPADGEFIVSVNFEDSLAVTQFRVDWGTRTGEPHSRIFNAVQDDDGRRDFMTGQTRITGLNPAKKYYMTITALNAVAGSSAVKVSFAPIVVPSDVQALPQVNGDVLVTWRSTSVAATAYEVQWWSSTTATQTRIVGKEVRALAASGLNEEDRYSFEVTALVGERRSAGSSGAEAQRVSAIDRSFGEGGQFDDDFKPVKTNIGALDQAFDVLVRPDGKVIVVGSSNGDYLVTRYTPTGALDTTFNGTGDVVVDLGGVDIAHAALGLDDGSILMVGTTKRGWGFVMLRADGSLDETFRYGGIRGITFDPGFSEAWNLARDPQGGRIYVAGIHRPDAKNPGEPYAFVQRFDMLLHREWQGDVPKISSITGEVTAMAVQPDGKALLACEVSDGIAVARFNDDGTADSEFGDNGHSIIHFGTSSQHVYGITLQADGSIILCGSKGSGGRSVFAVARLLPQGFLDPDFNQSGVATANFGKRARAVARDVTVLSSGEIVAAGSARGNFAVARFTAGGHLDSDFDEDGKATLDFGASNDSGAAIAVDKYGTLFAAGASGGDLAAARFFVSKVNAPSDFLVAPVETGGIQLLWTINARDMTDSVLQRAESLDGSWTTVQHEHNPGYRAGGSYYDVNVVAGATYYYRVFTYRDDDASLAVISEGVVGK